MTLVQYPAHPSAVSENEYRYVCRSTAALLHTVEWLDHIQHTDYLLCVLHTDGTKHHWPSIDRHYCSASLHHWILNLCEQFMHSAVMSKFPSLEAQYSLHFCPKCQSADNVSWHHHPAHCWATVLHCGPCNISWTICRECFSIQSHYTKSNQVTRHARNSHGDEKASGSGPVPPNQFQSAKSSTASCPCDTQIQDDTSYSMSCSAYGDHKWQLHAL